MLSVEDILQPENVSYTDNVWTWAVAHMLHKGEDWQITTITDTAPIEIVFLSKGEPLADYIISGNTLQNGTPTPEAPVDVVGCGEMSENLFYKTLRGMNIDANGRIISNSDFDLVVARVTAGETYSVTGCSGVMSFYVDEPDLSSRSYNNVRESIVSPVTIPQDVNYVAYRVGNKPNNAMFNAGATPIPYEPYGMYKLPISCGGTEYPIYLGQVQTTRRIKKLVLTGEENWSVYTNISDCYRLHIEANPGITGNGICSHYAKVETTSLLTDGTFVSGQNYSYFKDVSAQNLDGWKSYLAAQYSAGTPVTIWYVLETPETTTLNEPLQKIGDYADTVSMAQAGATIPTVAGANTLTIDTTVQPSEVSITGNIKEVQGT